MGAYQCIARNDVPPAVSRRIMLQVECELPIHMFDTTKDIFLIKVKPEVKVDNHVVGAPFGVNITLECLVEAFPSSVIHWERNIEGSSNPKFLMDG